MILDNTDPKSRTVISEGAAQVLTSAMEDVISDENGTGHGLINLGQMPVAGKTGTTSEWRDSWFVGYTPYYTCGIWAGYDNNEKMPDEGLYHTYSKILWNSIMNRLNAGQTIRTFRTTGDTVRIEVCRQSHMAAAPGCTDRYEEIYIQGTQPMNLCNIHGSGASVTGQPDLPSSDGQNITIFNVDQTTLNTSDVQPDTTAQQDQNSIPDQDVIPYQDTYPDQDISPDPYAVPDQTTIPDQDTIPDLEVTTQDSAVITILN